jgi:hypothetical protein
MKGIPQQEEGQPAEVHLQGADEALPLQQQLKEQLD